LKRWALALLLMGVAGTARADDPPIGRAAIGDDLMAYYGSERTTGLLFGALGVASVGAGSVLATRSGDFERGLGWSIVGLGALEIVGGGLYALQVGGEIDHYEKALASDPGAFKLEEGAHIEGTVSRFPIYRWSELGVAAVGVGFATYGFASKRGGWQGVGIGIAGEALSLFLLDAFGQARAHDYDKQIHRFRPSMALLVGGGDRPWGLAWSGQL